MIETFAPWDGRRVPVTLLGGYLGSGKTTLINELLATTEQPVAVLVNDVGSVNIDAGLIRRRHGDTIELTDGCVCCSLAGGLVDAFDMIRARATPPEHLVLELSGVSDPRRVMPWANSIGFRLDGVVVLVDVEQFLDRLDHETVGPTVRGQVEAADVLMLTKTDLVEPDQVKAVLERLRALVPDCRILQPGHRLAAANFLNIGTRHRAGITATDEPSLFDAHQTTTVALAEGITAAALQHLLDELPADVLRAKGVARLDSGELQLVQVVGRRQTVEPLSNAEPQSATDLVVIRPT